MKNKLKTCGLILLLTGIIFISSQVFGAVVTERKINTTTHTTTQSKNTIFANRIKTCTPYSESMKSDYLGMNINYKLKIDGWVNNKCRLNFSADVAGLSSSFSNLYGVNPSDVSVSTFTPKIRCEFTKQQLQYVGDSILEEQSRSNGGRMLKDPNSVSFPAINNLSSSDQRLLNVVLGQNACTILNSGDLNNLINSLMGY